MAASSIADWIKERPIAHRGYHDMNQLVWENTASAFDRAIQFEFAIECDLQMSSDGVPIVFHDYVLKRLCSVGGDVRDLSAAALTAMNVGETDDTIQTLEQMLRQISGRTGLVIELKPQEAHKNEAFARTVVKLLADYNGPAALMSFDRDLVSSLVAQGSSRPIGLTAYGNKPDQNQINRQALDIPIDFVSFHVSDLPCPFVETARAGGLPVITWTVRDRDAIELTMNYADQMTFEGFNPNDLQP